MYSPPFARYRADCLGVWYGGNPRDEARAIVRSVWAKHVERKGCGLVCGNALDARASPRYFFDMGSFTIECGIVGTVVMKHTRIQQCRKMRDAKNNEEEDFVPLPTVRLNAP